MPSDDPTQVLSEGEPFLRWLGDILLATREDTSGSRVVHSDVTGMVPYAALAVSPNEPPELSRLAVARLDVGEMVVSETFRRVQSGFPCVLEL